MKLNQKEKNYLVSNKLFEMALEERILKLKDREQ